MHSLCRQCPLESLASSMTIVLLMSVLRQGPPHSSPVKLLDAVHCHCSYAVGHAAQQLPFLVDHHSPHALEHLSSLGSKIWEPQS